MIISLGFDDGVKEPIQPPPTTITLGAMMWKKGDVFGAFKFWRLTQEKNNVLIVGERAC